MTSIDDLIAASTSAEPETETVEVLIGGELVALKFAEMQGEVWAGITVRNPPRLDVPLDMAKGYNIHSATQVAAAESGVRVDGDTETKLTEKQWRGIWKALSGADFQTVIDTVWSLNEWAPSQRVEAAKKASRAAAASDEK